MSRLKVSPLVLLQLLLATSVQAETLTDPTRPGSGSRVMASVSLQVDDLILNSVIMAGATSHAVINNKIYELGDKVRGVSIIAIDINSVSLSDGRKLIMYQAITESKGN